MFYKRKLISVLAVICLTATVLGGCGSKIATTISGSLTNKTVFEIGEASCSISEAKVYLANTQNQYEAVYGKDIWKAQAQNGTLEDRIKDQVLAELAQVKAMTLLAAQKELILEEEELEKVSKAAERYYNSLNATEKELLEIDQETLTGMYRDYALAEKVYHSIISGINPEISDDEARTIRIQAVFTVEKATAEQVKKLANDGNTFESLMERYDESGSTVLSFGKGEVETALEEAAFNLGLGEISDVIAVENGYYVIKCVSPFDEEETQLNKVKIAEKRKDEAFDKEYESFVQTLEKSMDEELWSSVTFFEDDSVMTDSFFEIYQEFFGQ